MTSRRFLTKWPFEWTSVRRRDAYGTQLKLLRNGLRIFAGEYPDVRGGPMSNGQALPILIAGGGIGGLAAAHALARKGFAVRVLEQAPEFREIGAGIQLGPNVFRALEKLDLKEAVLADAHRPPAMEMRCALSGERVTRIPLDEPRFREKFKQPYAVTHRHDLHSVFINACKNNNRIALETGQSVEDFEQDDTGVSVILQSGERIRGRALIGCDGMWSKVRDKVVGDGKPLVSGHIAYRAVLAREEVPDDLDRKSTRLNSSHGSISYAVFCLKKKKKVKS